MPMPLVFLLVLFGIVVAWAAKRALVARSDDEALRWGKPVTRERNLGAIASLWRVHPGDEAAREARVADRTWRDLSMDAVFARIDRCVTRVGQQVLYRRLRAPSLDPSAVGAFRRRVAAFEEDELLRSSFRRAMRPLAQERALDLPSLLFERAPALPREAKLAPAASVATLASCVASLVWPVALVALLLLVLANIALRMRLHPAMSIHVTGLASISDLFAASRNLAVLDTPHLATEIATLRDALARTRGHGTDVRWLTLDLLRTNEIVAAVITYLNVFLLLDVVAFVRCSRLVERTGASLRAMFETVGDLDAAWSVASFRAGEACCTPTFGPRRSPLAVAGLRHPLVEGAVPNDARLGSEGWLVLGSNMSGKSTFLRALAINAILAQSIATATCERYDGAPLVVRTLVDLQDDVLAKRSLFLAEAQAAQDMLVEGEGEADRLCVVDELFRGTNTVDRVAAGSAFLRALRRRGDTFVVAATHDVELVELLAGEYLPHHFEEAIRDGEIAFDHRLRTGASAPRNALAILALVGFPPEVVDDAAQAAGAHASWREPDPRSPSS